MQISGLVEVPNPQRERLKLDQQFGNQPNHKAKNVLWNTPQARQTLS